MNFCVCQVGGHGDTELLAMATANQLQAASYSNLSDRRTRPGPGSLASGSASDLTGSPGRKRLGKVRALHSKNSRSSSALSAEPDLTTKSTVTDSSGDELQSAHVVDRASTNGSLASQKRFPEDHVVGALQLAIFLDAKLSRLTVSLLQLKVARPNSSKCLLITSSRYFLIYVKSLSYTRQFYDAHFNGFLLNHIARNSRFC